MATTTQTPRRSAALSDGAYLDLLLLRAAWSLRSQTNVSNAKLAAEAGYTPDWTRPAVARLEREGFLHRHDGFHVTDLAQQLYGDDLWTCRDCGCVNEAACKGGCSWASADICTACLTRHNELTVRPVKDVWP